MRIVIIDNNDSFTYNLAHYVSQFTDIVDVFRSDNINFSKISRYNKIIISPGPGLPSEYPNLHKIIKIYHSRKSILGICLGHQAIAEYFNAKLNNLDIVKHGITSIASQRSNCSIFNNLPDSFQIGHYHSWIVEKDSFPNCLEVTSESNDGIITSFKHKKFDLQGLQFHPESILTDYGLKMIRNWVYFNHSQE